MAVSIASAHSRAVPAAVVELASVLALMGAYNLGRMLATGRVDSADDNALRILDLQAAVRLPSEAVLQAAALDVHHLVGIADRYYLLHFPVTIGVLLWLWRRDRSAYRWTKHALVLATGVAMVVHLVVPVTPPRLLAASGAVDTGQQAGASVYDGSPMAGLANEYAALPSLHVGWALLVALVLVVTLRSRWRWWWLLHPAFTTVTVVVTGNHYLLDAAAGAALVLLALLVTQRVRSAAVAEEPSRVAQVRADGVRRDCGQREGQRAGRTGGAQGHRGLDHAAARGGCELQRELGGEAPPGAALGPAVRPVELGGLHQGAQPGAGDVDPGLAHGRPGRHVRDPRQAGLPRGPVARLDQEVEDLLDRRREVHDQNDCPVSSS
ncbi:phosphatase PAP2 family protein [Nocardioides sp. W7]|uniref:phosphatase PAP2 family protein n=1 Tax=Nocardioides sp. W7 TaxID=2931390 RepID=UPI001FD0E6DF|nr:phosphatase PAP2 family protein [Nocardioides sp. W7]